MKKHIIITIILLIAAACITVVYFKNLSPPGMRTSRVMHTIPNNAALIFEFNNDQGFYDIFKTNKLLASIIGGQKIGELDTLRTQVLQNQLLAKYFTAQNIFVSVHPVANSVDLLLTISALKGFEAAMLNQLNNQQNSGLIVTPLYTAGKQGFNIYIKALKKSFYVINSTDNIFSGSFSKQLIAQCLLHESKKEDKNAFVLLPEQQNASSLANMYVNYGQLGPLLNQFFKNKNTDILKPLPLLPAFAALSLNYRNDALMFNGLTNIEVNKAGAYLSIFAAQQPVDNHLKDIFPSTTAYSVNFAVSSQLKFGAGLSQWHNALGLNSEKDQLFNKIKAETGINPKTEFNGLLGNEFAVITTRYLEKFAIIAVKDGSKLKLLMAGLSTMTDENTGQLNYDKLPFFLLGDAFGVFRRPFFMVIDNYLILANSAGELASYYDIYINRKFLSKNNQYNQFDNLIAARSNVAFFFQFKNLQQVLKNNLYAETYSFFEKSSPAWNDFYAASWQFTAADKNFYTNFCMKLNTDTTVFIKNNP